jgi:hypothetical protein
MTRGSVGSLGKSVKVAGSGELGGVLLSSAMIEGRLTSLHIKRASVRALKVQQCLLVSDN